VGLRCRHTPKHFSQVTAQTIPLTETPVGKNFAVLNIFFMGIFIETPSKKENSNIKVDI
jgi:hypothetical protein